MRDRKEKREYDPRYSIGDKVRIWKVFKNPVGKIRAVDAESTPIKYLVSYEYHEGGWYEEIFEENDLTLHSKLDDWYCNCKSVTGIHLRWCNKYQK